jgi:HCOMODA/2-hydroxy-3-carboxy-muconic semialdehyde decarboxylase
MNASSLVDPSVVQELVDANRILYNEGVLDAFGHVSARHDKRSDRFLLAANLAPALVGPDDILEFDLDGSPVVHTDRRLYVERFLHAEIYRARPDVMAIVHSHSVAVLPFSVSQRARLRPVCHMSGFLGTGAPVFDIRDTAGPATDLLIRDCELGAALAKSLDRHAVVLMRGHGSTVVAPSIRLAVYRAVYTEVNARVQLQAEQLGPITFLSGEEADATAESNEANVDRPWLLWQAKARLGST